jgi:hypothetical protein
MRLLAALGALCFLATCTLATAQVSVSAQMERTGYLLYERVDLLVTVANESENDIVLNNSEGHPWLSFLVSQSNRLPVRPERQGTFKPLTLKVGESKILRVNLTPLFSFREEGDYKAAAVIDLPGEGQIISDGVPFSVQRGRQVWSESRPVGGSQRIYSLLRFSPSSDKTNLYLRVEDPSENVVFTNIALGEVVAYIDPEVFFDPQGNLHVLQPIAMGTYLYTRADPAGKVLHQVVFKSGMVPGIQGTIPPRLAKMDDGNVIVGGGVEQNPGMQHEMLSQGQSKVSDQAAKKPDSSDMMPAAEAAPSISQPPGT